MYNVSHVCFVCLWNMQCSFTLYIYTRTGTATRTRRILPETEGGGNPCTAIGPSWPSAPALPGQCTAPPLGTLPDGGEWLGRSRTNPPRGQSRGLGKAQLPVLRWAPRWFLHRRTLRRLEPGGQVCCHCGPLPPKGAV